VRNQKQRNKVMKVFLTGGTGFVGSEIVRQLVADGHVVRALVRKGSEDKLAVLENVEVFPGDVTDAGSLVNAMVGCDAIIHLVGIIREFPGKGVTFKKMHVEATENILQAAEEQGVQRYLHMSSNGVREGGSTDYHRSKWQGEELVRESPLDWTIFRPSLIFGQGSEFVNILAALIRKLPVVPVIGNGKYRMQPVAVDQVAASFVKALGMSETIGKAYQLGGGASYSYDEILDLTARALGKEKVCKIHQPLFMIKPMIRMMQGFDQFPITEDQLKMLVEGNVCDPQEWVQTFNLKPLSFADGIEASLQD
jgi:NADH dehydrogenase